MTGAVQNQNFVIYVRNFTVTPGPRMKEDGEYSGEEFRKRHLAPGLQNAVRKKASLTVVLDGTMGYGAAFLEEAFGGLVRAGHSKQTLRDHLRVVSRDRPWYEHEVDLYISGAA